MKQSMDTWDNIFIQQGKVFTEPHEDMPKFVEYLKETKANTILDLGCGTGRHVVYLSRHNFSVYGLDNSPEALKITRQWLHEKGLDANLRLQSMTGILPYKDSYFDAVLSVQVIHHADEMTIREIVKEVKRVLKNNGLLFITVPSTRNKETNYEQIESNTFIPLDGPEKGLLHHYFTPEELQEAFRDFDIFDFHLDVWQHFCLLGFKR